MSQFVNSLNEVRKNYKVYDEWEQKQADERARKEYLAANLQIPDDEIALTKKRAEAVVRATEIMDARSEDNCQDVEQLTQVISTAVALPVSFLVPFIPEIIARPYLKKFKEQIKAANGDQKLISSLQKKQRDFEKKIAVRGQFAGIGLVFLTAIGFILWGNSKQKEASRIGRFQAKNDELKGLENFVVYTPQQFEKAQEIAKSIPDEKERKGLFKMISELKAISRDKVAYKQWLANRDLKEIEKLKQLNLSPEQLQQAEADKELIVDTVKEINIQAEEYAENVENAYDTLGTLSWLLAIPSMMGINKLLYAIKASPVIRKTVSFLVPLLISLGISIKGTFEEKTASRIGRYKARQEILSNPQRLMAFSKEEMQKVEHIKAPIQKQGFFEKIGDNFRFLGIYGKDKKEYKKYKESVQNENEKLQKAFKQIEITEEQKTEAQALKKNVFRAFDEIDEMSQRYSEDTEAGAEIAKQSFSTVWSLASILGTGALGVALLKGKVPISKIINKIVNISFKPDSSIKKAVNELYSELEKSGKSKIIEFQKDLICGRIGNFLGKAENSAIKNKVGSLIFEASSVAQPAIAKMRNNKGGSIVSDLVETLTPHLKDSFLAKWTRDMLVQIGKIFINKKVLSYDVIEKSNLSSVEVAEIKKNAGLDFSYKNYKTLINTGLAAGLPVLATIFAVPYAFNAWLTNIQKKAGKIGIMKAMDSIDDPRVFARDINGVVEEGHVKNVVTPREKEVEKNMKASTNNVNLPPNIQNLLNSTKDNKVAV